METYLLETEIIKKLEEQNIGLFTVHDFKKLFSGEANSIYKRIKRLKESGLIKKLINGKYLFFLKKPSEFEIANFLYNPSYVSLESALSFYSIITGFPYQITSVTVKKPKNFTVFNKDYQYSRISSALFWGYEKQDNYLMASKEKTLLDYLYLAYKGLRNWDKEEFDLSSIDKKRLKEYFGKVKDKRFFNFLKGLNL